MGGPCSEEIGGDHGAEAGVVVGVGPVGILKGLEFLDVGGAGVGEAGELSLDIVGLVVASNGPGFGVDWWPGLGGVAQG